MNTVNRHIEKTNQTTVNSEYIDSGITSIKVGETDRGSIKMRCDKLSFVSSAVVDELNEDRLDVKLGKLESDETMKVRRYQNRARKGQRKLKHYRRVVVISFIGKSKAKLRIDYRPLKRKKRAYVRFELSPQHFGPARLTQMIEWLADTDRLGRRLYKVLSAAWVTRCDIALDLYGYSLSDCYLQLSKAEGASFF